MARRRTSQRPQRNAALTSAALLCLLAHTSSATTLPLRAAAAESTAVPSPVADSQCGCFMTNGSDTDYYSNHKFFDFRSLSNYENAPALLTHANETSNALASSTYFTSDSWKQFWQIQNWNTSAALSASNTTLLRINSLNNVYIEQNTDPNPASDTWLSLRTARQRLFQSAAEIVTNNDTFQYLSMRMLARTVGAPGGCTAMFTYASGSDSSGSGSQALQEADIEVLTKYPRTHVQCTNQPSIDADGQLIDAATANVSLPDDLGWDDWAVYRLDWTPRQSTWFVGGQQVANISFQVPRDASRIHLNAWSDGSSWTGLMGVNTEAHLQIQWWEILYNSTAGIPVTAGTGQNKDGVCGPVCSIDAIDAANGTVGQAVLLPNATGNSSTNSAASWPRPTAMATWLPSISMLLYLLFI